MSPSPACSTCGLGVDWLRACYVHEWRLFKDSPIFTKGRYYFAPPNTRFVAGFHHLGSATWYDRNNGLAQGMGARVDSPPKRWEGNPPTVPPNLTRLGSAECLSQGELIANAIPGRDLHDGFPAGCYIGESNLDAWHRVSSFNQCSLQRFYARIIEWLYDDAEANILEAFNLLLEGGCTVKVRPQARNFPAVVTVNAPGLFVCVCDGTRTFQQLALQAFYFIEEPQDFGLFGTNKLWYEASSYILGICLDDGLVPGKRVMFAGHSYGAATVLALAARLQRWGEMSAIAYLTYGCPKTGDERFRELIRLIPGVNLANDDDIVTSLPPDLVTLYPVMIALVAFQLMPWSTWFRPGNQIAQDDDGTLSDNAFPLLDFSVLLALAENVIAGAPITPVGPHAIPEYRRRIELRCPDAAWPVDKELSEWLEEASAGLEIGAAGRTASQLVLGDAGAYPISELRIGSTNAAGATCEDATLLTIDVPFVYFLGPNETSWVKCPVLPFPDAYWIDAYYDPALVIQGACFDGPDCANLTNIGLTPDFGHSFGGDNDPHDFVWMRLDNGATGTEITVVVTHQ